MSSKGFSNIPFFGGSFSLDKKKLLILLAGYEIDRPLLLWRELEPSKVILVKGIEPTQEGFLEGNEAAIKELQEFGPSEPGNISASDPLRARDGLIELFERESKNYNIIVSPLNTKLQAVGCEP